MLQLKTVEPNTFSILKQLMEIDELKDFSLVGGTALSLLYGHRQSVDLDLFSNKSFDNAVSDTAGKISSNVQSGGHVKTMTATMAARSNAMMPTRRALSKIGELASISGTTRAAWSSSPVSFNSNVW